MVSGDHYVCVCGYEWRTKKDIGGPSVCPHCKNHHISNLSEIEREEERKEALKREQEKRKEEYRKEREYKQRLTKLKDINIILYYAYKHKWVTIIVLFFVLLIIALSNQDQPKTAEVKTSTEDSPLLTDVGQKRTVTVEVNELTNDKFVDDRLYFVDGQLIYETIDPTKVPWELKNTTIEKKRTNRYKFLEGKYAPQFRVGKYHYEEREGASSPLGCQFIRTNIETGNTDMIPACIYAVLEENLFLVPNGDSIGIYDSTKDLYEAKHTSSGINVWAYDFKNDITIGIGNNLIFLDYPSFDVLFQQSGLIQPGRWSYFFDFDNQEIYYIDLKYQQQYATTSATDVFMIKYNLEEH